jgi:chromosome segregation ATPase
LPICSKCGSYFSETSCPLCTPDDSPKSPVSTVHAEEKESIRIIDPLKLVESIEQIETEFVILEEEKDKEIMNLEEQILENRRKEASLKGEINDISVKLSESEKSREARLQDKSAILNKHNVIVEEINSLKAKILNLETEIDQIERENKDITISLEGD